MPLRLHTCQPGREAALIAELGRVFPPGTHRLRSPGWVQSQLVLEDETREVSVAFAGQCLPEPAPVAAPSVSAWAKLVGALVVEGLREHAGPWRLHVFCVDYPGGPVGAVRAGLVEEAILAWLKEKQRRLVRTRVADHTMLFAENEVLIQVGLETAGKGWFCLTPPALRQRLRRCISRFPGGQVVVPEDERAPSKAHRKLLEVEIRLGRRIAPGESCVDLGGSPGGWSFVALERGASVVAVDRSPLREDLMANPRLTFVKGDAFKYEPEASVDWLLCDVIAFPERTLELIEQWLKQRWCRYFCVTVKFRGEDDYPTLERIKAVMRRSRAAFEVRQLQSNRNEVTVFGMLEIDAG